MKTEILDLRRKGYSYNQIIKELGCAKSTVSFHCKLEGLDNPNACRKPSGYVIDKINELYVQGKTIKFIKLLLKLNKGTVSKYITRESKLTRNIPYKKKKSQHVINWRVRTKQKLVEYKGGKCHNCGYDKCIHALHFHHFDKKEKEFNVSGKSYSFDRLKKEIDKCVLLCSNCHAEEHYCKKGKP